MSRHTVETRYVAISRVKTWAVAGAVSLTLLPLPVTLSESNKIPEPIDLATSLPTNPLEAVKSAKLVR